MRNALLLLVVTHLFLGAASAAWAAPDCTGLNREVDRWETYLKRYGSPVLKDPAGILAYGNNVVNSHERLLDASHETDVSTIFVKNPSGDFIRVVTSVPVGVAVSRQAAVGTTLTRGGAAWTALTKGTAYCGAVTLFGNVFDSVYRPIVSGGAVIGALYVGDAP